jgi:two-component sensor histidine kinase
MPNPRFVVDFESGGSGLRESNHRVANNLMTIATLLRRQARELTSIDQPFTADQVRQILSEAGQRIEMVGRLHRRLAQPIAPNALNLSPYLHDVAETVIASLSAAGEVELAPISGEMCPIEAQQALLIGFLVGELACGAVRAIRSAEATTRLGLACRERDGGLEIVLAIQGARVSEGDEPGLGDGFGSSVARMLVAQLKATLTFQSGDIGCIARLFVPMRTGIDLSQVGAAGEA